MNFVEEECKTILNAKTISVKQITNGMYGYFADTLEALKFSLKKERTTSRCWYGKLTNILGENEAKRYVMGDEKLMFSLFYPTDDFLNTQRY